MPPDQNAAAAFLTAREEWRRMWPLPVVAMLGYAGSSIFGYASGAFLGTMTNEFGWSRADFSSGFTIQVLLIMVMAPLIGRLVDRIGPRRMVLIGFVPFLIGFAILGLADGSVWQWRVLCVLQGLGAAFMSPVAWMTAVVGRFHASRGTALAVAQAGLGVSTAVWPVASAYYIELLGWRTAFPALVVTWAVIVMPLVYLFFFGPHDVRVAAKTVPGGAAATAATQPRAVPPGVWRTLWSRTFICLVLAGGLFASMSLGITLHIVPILQSGGFDLVAAAQIAGIAGVATLIGRLGTGVLLDRYPAKVVAIITFFTPVVAILLLRQFNGSYELSVLAAVIFGLTTGAESDVLTYIASRVLPQPIFASCYAIILALFAVFASMGPLLAGKMFDVSGSYDSYLLVVIPVVLVSTVLISLIPPPPVLRDGH